MTPIMEFKAFPKIPRLSRECVITEKIDGTNAQIYIPGPLDPDYGLIFAGSRNRWLTPGRGDNFGFAQWVADNKDELLKLGPGRHFGEWWGSGIQRGYGLTDGERRFSLFHTHGIAELPPCCSVVPVLYRGNFSTGVVNAEMWRLQLLGSAAAPGFDRPEGIVIFHTAAGVMFKKTIEGDEKPKGQAA